MLSLYTLSSYRGKGAGKALCSEAFRWLKTKNAADDDPKSKQLRVRIMAKPENTATVKMYEGLGFEGAGRCTLAEALTANGDGEMVPEDGGGQKYNNRTGLIMVKTFERE
jgi:L-amino acid N-acyltransferase YncA